ncbi:MAG: alpha/beta fold hydrolase [Candidatus Hydrogenedentes bacterium]|nr:alpha/beta fold hydrolase [Candidatus Hydrogenedentota bacterium]
MKKTGILTIGIALFWVMSTQAVATDYYFDSDGVKIQFTSDGEGDAVILIHGYQATGSLNWKMPGIVRMLSNDYRVIVMDVRGHGKSEDAPDDAYGIEAVHDVIRLMDHVGLQKAHIAGYSMGGMITIKLVTMYPRRVRSAIVGGMGWVSPGSITLRTENLDDKFVKIFNGFAEYSTTETEMRAIETPLTVIVGTKDEGQLRRVARWQEIVPSLPVVYVEGANHIRCVFRPGFKNAVKEFLDAQPK